VRMEKKRLLKGGKGDEAKDFNKDAKIGGEIGADEKQGNSTSRLR